MGSGCVKMESEMTLKSLAYGAAGAIVLMGTMAILDAAPASARCAGYASGMQASGKLRFFTEGKARRSWSERARRAYGAEFGNWNRARNKTMNCHKGAPGGTWYCTARGRACN